MARHYVHLTYAERKLIGVLRLQRKSIAEIATILGRSRSTIYRELKRFPHHGNYEASRVDARANRMHRKQRRPYKMMVPEIAAYVKAGLEKLWSPEQIAGRLRREGRRFSISHQCIYDWLYRDKKSGGTWCRFLRINRRKRRSVRGRSCIPNRRGIELRPKNVNSRRYFGDWEGDTVLGKLNTGAVVSMVERKSLFTMVGLLKSKNSEKVNAALIRLFSEYPALPRRTLTLDNGTEFSGHEALGKALGLDVYFAAPQAAWQRGLNENTNGLIRQYLPRRSDFRLVTPERVAEIQQSLNNRPRKKLGYRTPMEAMARKAAPPTVALVI